MYQVLVTSLINKGLHAEQTGPNTILVSGNENMVSLSFIENSWSVWTMRPACYLIPENARIEDLCYEVLFSNDFDSFLIPEIIVADFSLKRVTEREFRRYYDAIQMNPVGGKSDGQN
jgi:hypothetical protein